MIIFPRYALNFQVEEAEVREQMTNIPGIKVQMSTPLKQEAKQNHVRFATPTQSVHNGRVSPIADETVIDYIHMPSGFPFIHNKMSGPLSDSLVVQTSGSCDITAASLIEQSQFEEIESNYSTNNSVFNVDGGGEENEPPGSGNGGNRRGQGQRPKEGQPARSSQSSGNLYVVTE